VSPCHLLFLSVTSPPLLQALVFLILLLLKLLPLLLLSRTELFLLLLVFLVQLRIARIRCRACYGWKVVRVNCITIRMDRATSFRSWSASAYAHRSRRTRIGRTVRRSRRFGLDYTAAAELRQQKRQDGSAFALTYSLLLRSCRRIGAFVISPLPPLLNQTLCTARPLGSAGITPPLRYYQPRRHRFVFDRFPGCAGYTTYLAPPISRWDQDRFSSCSACPCHRAVPTTPPK